MKNNKYNVMIVGNTNGECRQFQVSGRAVIATVTALVALVLFLGTMVMVRWEWNAGKYQEELAVLTQEHEKLKLANEAYLKASIDMENKLRSFDEKTIKLAQYVGLETSGLEVDGVGGPEILENELNQYLRYDLGLMDKRAEQLDSRFDNLETAFTTQKARLDATPSILPARGWISSGYKYRTDPFTKKRSFHSGIDISCPEGTPIYAPADGVVVKRGYSGGFGKMLEISHGDDMKTRYGHLSQFNVSKGSRVKRGDLIGYVGSTGRSTAPHLHYEIHKNDKQINPMKYIIRDAKTF